MSAPSRKPRKKGLAYWLPTTLTFVIGLAVWAITWILPLTSMVAMAWGCETQARALSRRALAFCEGEASTTNAAIDIAGKAKTRGTTHTRSCAAPRSLSRWPSRSRSRIRQSRPPPDGPRLARRAGSLVALSLVIVTAVWGARR